MYTPKDEGITHINAYSKSNNLLGRMLSNICEVSVKINDVTFRSLEGYWYYLLLDSIDNTIHEDVNIMNVLTSLTGFEVKGFIRSIKLDPSDLKTIDEFKTTKEFKDKICEAIKLKIEQNENLKQSFMNNKLPITHYYYYGNIDNCKILADDKYSWIPEYLNKLSDSYRG